MNLKMYKITQAILRRSNYDSSLISCVFVCQSILLLFEIYVTKKNFKKSKVLHIAI